MSVINIEKEHNLTDDQLETIAEGIGNSLVARYGGGTQWRGDRLCYSLPGSVDAYVEWDDSQVTVHAELGLMMVMLKPVITAEIERELENHL